MWFTGLRALTNSTNHGPNNPDITPVLFTGLGALTNSTNHGPNSPDITPEWFTGLRALTNLCSVVAFFYKGDDLFIKLLFVLFLLGFATVVLEIFFYSV